jgi:hypothetical protein
MTSLSICTPHSTTCGASTSGTQRRLLPVIMSNAALFSNTWVLMEKNDACLTKTGSGQAADN